MINYSPHVSVQHSEKGSRLVIAEAKSSDSGNYSCVPDPLTPDSVKVLVIREGEEKGPAAVYTNRSSFISTDFALILAVCVKALRPSGN